MWHLFISGEYFKMPQNLQLIHVISSLLNDSLNYLVLRAFLKYIQTWFQIPGITQSGGSMNHCIRCLTVVLLMLLAGDAVGQVREDCDAMQDFSGVTIKKAGTNATVPTAKAGAYYSFTMNYDYGVVTYIITEFRKNSSVIELNNWCRNKVTRNLDAEDLAGVSRTKNIVLSTGDSLSFYREFGWYDPATSTRTANGYYAEDSLDYAVELVNATSGARLALLDSFGVLKQVPSGYPSMHGTRPIFTEVNYTVPSQYNNIQAFIRVRLYSRGDGPYYVVRRDGVSFALSDRLQDSAIISHIAMFGGGLKPAIRGSSVLEGNDAVTAFTVSPNPTKGHAEIFVELSSSDEPVTIAIYDPLGSLVFMPVLGRIGSNSIQVDYDFGSSGWYTVAVYRNAVVVARKTIHVTQ